MTALASSEFQAHTERIEQLVQRVSSLADEEARTAALELLQSMMDLHAAGISRIVEMLNSGEAGRASLAKLGSDPLVCGLLVLYGVHPVSLEDRVARAVENVRPQLRKHSGTAELIGITDDVVRVKIQSTGHGCGSSVDALKGTVEQAILEAAPEVVGVVVEGVPASATGFVPLNLIQPASVQPVSKQEKTYEESAA
jgi:Fe-S cluster biogenesis protein NfuA